MKRIPTVILLLLVVAALPYIASAQYSSGFFPGSSPWNLGLNQASCRGYVGWAASYRDLTFSFDPGAAGGATGGSHCWRLSGLWVGAEKQIYLTEKVGFFLDGWYLFAGKRSASEQEEFTRTVLLGPFFDPSNERTFFIPSTSSGTGGRPFDTLSEWWYADAAGTYEAARNYFVLAGLRYEHFSVRFENAGAGVGIPSAAGEEADITVNSYVPYVGIQTVQRGSSGKFSSRIIGFPLVPARVSHFETGEAGNGIRTESRGHFMRGLFCEFFSTYDLTVNDNVEIGAFVRWNYLTGKASLDTDVMGFSSASNGAVFSRNIYTVGASVSLAFMGL